MKRLICFIAAAILALTLPVYALAAAEYDGGVYRITDWSDTLSDAERDELDEKICRGVERYYCDFTVIILEGQDFLDEDETLADFAEMFYDNSGYGVGAGRDGTMLLADAEYGTYGIYTEGSMVQLLTEEAAETACDAFDAALLTGGLYDAVDAYLDAMFLEAEKLGSEQTRDLSEGPVIKYTDPFVPYHDYDAPRVVDGADIFTDAEEDDLAGRIAEMGERLGNDFVIVTVNDTGRLSHMEYADDFFDYNGYGLGPDYDGMLLLICMNSQHRGWWISTYAECFDRFWDRDIDDLGEAIKPYLSAGEYYRAAEVYLDGVEEVFARPADYHTQLQKRESVRGAILPALIVALIAALIVIAVLRGKMKTVRTAGSAAGYMVKDSFYLRRQSDTFLHSHVTKTRKQSSSSSGHSSHSSSSGRSHGGGGGSF
ncbi:MAG: TPM domain-containing protein [Oscillospiraceae bacterium]|nr:TPM domain-containing protein [Oscillospiraceae bacterium]